MKTQKLRRNIIINLSASLALMLIAASIIFYTFEHTANSDTEIAKIRSTAIEIKSQARELESKTNDAKKYKEVWKTIGDNRKSTQVIKMEEVNAILDSLAEKYTISNYNLQVVLPENLNSGIFNRKTLDVTYTSGTMSFDALSDVRALSFIIEFFNKLPGYPIITNIEFGKTQPYNNLDLVNISLGKNAAAVKAKISFSWYTFKEKEKVVK